MITRELIFYSPQKSRPAVHFAEPPAPSVNCKGAMEMIGVSVHIPSHAAAVNANMQPLSVNTASSSASPPVGVGASKDDLTHANHSML